MRSRLSGAFGRGATLQSSVLILLALLTLPGCARRSPPHELAWAYPHAPRNSLPSAPAGVSHVPGSPLAFSKAQLDDELNPVDWRPASHPAPPAIVAHGRPEGPTPCAACHLFTGQGNFATPDLAGLPDAYIIAQVHAFRDGERRSADPARADTREMIEVARRVGEPDLRAAAAYFSALPRHPGVRVLESAFAPAVRPLYWGAFLQVPERPPEPIGRRIIEVPADAQRAPLGDSDVGIVDYAPPGSVARGRTLALLGGGAGQPCAGCHGPDLRGTALAPPLAGRSAPYLARAIWDIRTSARHEAAAAPMRPVARGLSPGQITDLAAYLASRPA